MNEARGYLQSLDVRNVSLQDMDVTPSKSEELLGRLLVPNEAKDRVVWRLAQLLDELQLQKKKIKFLIKFFNILIF